MSDSADPALWLRFAEENGAASRTLLEAGCLNPCLQNCHQAIEKSLKAATMHRGLPVKRTHNIRELAADLRRAGADLGLSDDDCELIDSIYIPSKYPPVSALPDAMPDVDICRRCLEIAERALAAARAVTGKP